VVVARDLGAGRHDNVSRSVHTSITLALISGVGMAVFGVIMVRHLLEWMSSPTDVIDLATVYLRIYFLGMPANMLYNFGAAILRAQGDTQRPLYFLMAAGIVNVVLNLCFVIGLGMDVDGVALAQRVTVDCVKNVNIAKKAIKKAFQNQIEGKGYSIVEVLSTCPTNWGLSPIKAMEWLEENMIPYYPLGVKKDKGAE